MDSKNENNCGCHIFLETIILIIKLYYQIIKGFILLFIKPYERDVSNDIVLVTGTGHGIGKELALQYSKLGATVVCWDINEKLNNETLKEIKNLGGTAYGYICDVGDREQVIKIGEKVKKDVGPVTIIVNNAGIMPTHSLLDHTEAEIRKLFDINVLAHFWIIQTFLPDMIEMNNGHIVALSSVAGLVGVKNLVPYCGTKFAVRGMMEALHEELRNDPRKLNIKFTNIYPYMVDTGLCKKPIIKFKEFMKLIQPKDAAAAIIAAQRQGQIEVSIPKHLHYMQTFTRTFPHSASLLVADFFKTGIESDL